MRGKTHPPTLVASERKYCSIITIYEHRSINVVVNPNRSFRIDDLLLCHDIGRECQSACVQSKQLWSEKLFTHRHGKCKCWPRLYPGLGSLQTMSPSEYSSLQRLHVSSQCVQDLTSAHKKLAKLSAYVAFTEKETTRKIRSQTTRSVIFDQVIAYHHTRTQNAWHRVVSKT